MLTPVQKSYFTIQPWLARFDIIAFAGLPAGYLKSALSIFWVERIDRVFKSGGKWIKQAKVCGCAIILQRIKEQHGHTMKRKDKLVSIKRIGPLISKIGPAHSLLGRKLSSFMVIKNRILRDKILSYVISTAWSMRA